MALSIKNPETEKLARDLAKATGESVTEAVTKAIRNRLDAVRPPGHRAMLLEDIRKIQDLVATLPDRDQRNPNDVLDCDELGLPI